MSHVPEFWLQRFQVGARHGSGLGVLGPGSSSVPQVWLVVRAVRTDRGLHITETNLQNLNNLGVGIYLFVAMFLSCTVLFSPFQFLLFFLFWSYLLHSAAFEGSLASAASGM